MSLTEQEAIAFLVLDSGSVPGSRYGWDSHSCAPIAYAVAVILESETGEEMTTDSLNYVMGLVVNNHEDPAYLLANYGTEYGFKPEDYLETEDLIEQTRRTTEEMGGGFPEDLTDEDTDTDEETSR